MNQNSSIKVFALATVMSLGIASVAPQSIKAAPQPAPVAVGTGMVDLTQAAESAVNSVVYIKVTTNSKRQMVEYTNPFEDFFGDFFGQGNGGTQRRQIETPKKQGAGSGVIISQDGYIVTNNHVVADADEILVKTNDNKEYKGRIIGLDKTTDLALIKVEATGLQAIPIGDSDKLKLGEWVLAVGNPFNLTSTVTAGIVSAKSRSLQANDIESFIQTDAAINPGNSGGALVNAKGELVGINAMLYSQTGSFSGYGFAIPTTIMNKVVADLKKYGTVQRALLGISGMEVGNYVDYQKDKNNKDVDLGTTEGIYVDEVTNDGAAAAAGLQKGDVILKVDGKPVKKMGELQEEITTHRPGDKVNITYMRDKKTYTKVVTLRNSQGTTSEIEQADVMSLGIALKPLDSELKKQLALDHGLLVTSVRSGKMQDAGITKGLIIMQVNDKKMNTVADFDEVVKQTNLSSDRVLWIRAKTQSGINKSFTVDLSDSQAKKAEPKQGNRRHR